MQKEQSVSIQPRATKIAFDVSTTDTNSGMMLISLEDGRLLGVPLAWYPKLAAATQQQRAAVRIGAIGLHWAELDQDILLETLLRPQTIPADGPEKLIVEHIGEEAAYLVQRAETLLENGITKIKEIFDTAK
jgi:hypothetical protein